MRFSTNTRYRSIDLANALAILPLKAGEPKYYARPPNLENVDWETDVLTHPIREGQTLLSIVEALNLQTTVGLLYVNVKVANPWP